MTSNKSSFDHAKDARELMDQIWMLAAVEAYGARDAARRMEAMQGLSRLQVVEAYFAENPEIRRWVDRHVEGGTCAAAVHDLRAKMEERRQAHHPAPEARPPGELRIVTTQVGDQTINEFYGDPRAWMEDFASPARRNLDKEKTTISDGAPTNDAPVRPDELDDFLRQMREQAGKIPSKEAAERQAKKAFEPQHVTRLQVHKAHKKIFGRQRPGPR